MGLRWEQANYLYRQAYPLNRTVQRLDRLSHRRWTLEALSCSCGGCYSKEVNTLALTSLRSWLAFPVRLCPLVISPPPSIVRPLRTYNVPTLYYKLNHVRQAAEQGRGAILFHPVSTLLSPRLTPMACRYDAQSADSPVLLAVILTN